MSGGVASKKPLDRRTFMEVDVDATDVPWLTPEFPLSVGLPPARLVTEGDGSQVQLRSTALEARSGLGLVWPWLSSRTAWTSEAIRVDLGEVDKAV